MAGSITDSESNDYHFISLKGQVQSLAMMIEPLSRPGVDGHAYRQLGRRGEPFNMLGVVDCDDAQAVRDLVVDLKALQGTMVTLTDDFGVETDNVMLLEVEKVDQLAVVSATPIISTSAGQLLYMRFLFQLTELPEEV